ALNVLPPETRRNDAAALRGFSRIDAASPMPRPDLVIVARGGGSIEDLWAFNEEIVVRAIAESAIPVISAVGHETDTTLADFAADMRAPTPTAAAEMAVPVRAELAAQLAELALRKRRCAMRPIALGRERLEARIQRLPKPEALLASAVQRLDHLAERLPRALRDRTTIDRERLGEVARNLSLPLLRSQIALAAQRLRQSGFTPALIARQLARAQDSFATLDRVLPQLDPDKPLERGFARVTDLTRRTLVSREQAAEERMLLLHFRDGELPVSTINAPARRARPAATSPGQGDLF
ncbi:MAG: exodeoxyribonuclease VII large subunit, partial [Novosphingobium sp.]|nr:exodeoxyribonuclease VII large subunit [Novosphingobium sp.]